ncbi:LPS export ABC transporter periplasmic protein LptC [Sphingobacterium hungaricum]
MIRNMLVYSHIKKFIQYTIIMLFGMVIFVSCENDMKDIDRLANIKQEEEVNISKHVTVIYSDSSLVKAQMTSPEMREYTDSVRMGNIEFPKGILIIFYGPDKKETQRIKSDYAIQKPAQGLTEFRKNVVVNMQDGSVIKTEQLFYDEKNAKYYNTVPIVFDFKDSRGSLYATSFESDLNFNAIDGESMTGYIIPTENSAFPSFGN